MTTINVKGMHCHACEAIIKDALEDIDITDCSADWKSGKVTFKGDETKAKLAIIDEGYEVL